MKAVAVLVCALGLSFSNANYADAQAVSSGMLSGPSGAHRKSVMAQPVISAPAPRAVAKRRAQPDPVVTGSVPPKPRN